MKKLLYILFLLIILNIYAVNHMDQMTYMSGEFAGSEYGCAMASIDFNGDGFQDLVVASQAWNPAHVYAPNQSYGKLYFYWGGPNFDNVPDFVIEGTYVNQLGNAYGGMSLYNAGDLNNDGIDDLIVNERSVNYVSQVAVYLGRAEPQNTPDYILTFLYPDVDWVLIAPLGDINGDNHADLSLILYATSLVKVLIWSDVTSQPWLLKQTNNRNWRSRFCGIGDVNGDNVSDGYMFMPLNASGGTHNKMTVLFGNPIFPETDSLIVCEDTNAYTTEWGSPVGDFNGDGIDDFVAYDNHLWIGRSHLTAQWDVALSAVWTEIDLGFTENCTGYPFVHGDLNGDGYQDIIGSNHEFGGYSGCFYVWMGRNYMNGTLDFQHQAPAEYAHRNFGYSKVTGDFNADGFCDVAVGAPWWSTQSQHNETGRVYIYAGNAELEDTTVANNDNVVSVIEQDWKIDVYPNPVKNDATIRFTTAMAGLVRLEVCNIKGQLVRELCNAPYNKGQHSFVWDGKDNYGKTAGSGLYIFTMQTNNTIAKCKAVKIK